MKLLKCKFCGGEVDIIENEYAIQKKIRCRQCQLSNLPQERKDPEIVIIKKRSTYST